jgi:concanavalin A-like lectin/glucanase superfamily protein
MKGNKETMSATIVGNWQLDEGMGSNAKDSSGNTNDGELSPIAPTWTGGRKPASTALHFDGSNSVKVIGNPPPLTVLESSTVTVEAWVRSCGPVSGSLHYILSKGGEGCIAASYALYAGERGGLSFYISHEDQAQPFFESPDAGTSVWDGNWHHIAGTYDGKTVRLYVDGHQIGDGTDVPDSTNIVYNLPVNEFFIGSYGEELCPFPYSFTGDIAEVRVWDGVLSDSEILVKAQS